MIHGLDDRPCAMSGNDQARCTLETLHTAINAFSLHDSEDTEWRQIESTSALGFRLREDRRIAFDRSSYDVVTGKRGLNQDSTLLAPWSDETRGPNQQGHRLLMSLEPRRKEFPVEIEEHHDIGAMNPVKSRVRSDEDVMGCFIDDHVPGFDLRNGPIRSLLQFLSQPGDTRAKP